MNKVRGGRVPGDGMLKVNVLTERGDLLAIIYLHFMQWVRNILVDEQVGFIVCL